MCDACVLKMDHHCPWLDNCIGFGNYKFFMQTLYYATITTLLMSCACGWLGYYVTHQTDMMGIDITRLVIGIIVTVMAGFMGLILVVFLTTHISMVLQGVTTIEVYEKRGFGSDDGCFRTLCCPRKDTVTGKPNHSIYRLPSALANLKAAMGDDVWLWWLPTLPKRKTGSVDGIHFQTSIDINREAVEMEDDSPLIAKFSSPMASSDR
jgi:palmitoyltransferase